MGSICLAQQGHQTLLLVFYYPSFDLASILNFKYNSFMQQHLYVGIRREDKSIWERRTPLIPRDIKDIMNSHPHIKFICQPSKLRIYSDAEYQEVGAIIQQDLSDCHLIVGVKEVPVKSILPDTTYLIFSHVIKGQPQNMDMLDEFIKKRVRLLDYERIIDQNRTRLIAFGQFAGTAGAIDYLAGFGQYLLKAGYSTPFLNVSMSYKYFSIDDALQDIKRIGDKLKISGIPKQFQPMIFAVTGGGRTATGVFRVLNLLPVKIVECDQIMSIIENKDDPEHGKQIYLINIRSENVIVPRDPSAKFDKVDYYTNPKKYKNVFKSKFLPHITCLFHCIYWETKYPRYLKTKHLSKLNESNNLRLIGICDITCDFQGSIQFLTSFTSPDKPFFFFDSSTSSKTYQNQYKKNKILYLAVDFLPCELAFDASKYFSSTLKKWIPNIVQSNKDAEVQKQGLLPELQRAVITCGGQLTPGYQYIQILRAEYTLSLKYTSSMQKQMMGIIYSGGEMGGVHSLQLNNTADISYKGLKRRVLNFDQDQ